MSLEQNEYTHLIISGDLFLKDSQNDEAISCYKKAIQISDTKQWEKKVLLQFYNNLGVAYKRKRDFLQAEKIFEEGIRLEPNHQIFYTNLFNIYKLQNRVSAMESLLLKAINLPQKELRHFITLIDFYKDMKNYKKAFDLALNCVALFKDKYDAQLTLGNLFVGIKSYKQALDPYLAAIAIDKNSTSAYNNIGVVYKELGEYEKAKAAYEKVLELKENDPAVHNNLGNLLRNMDDFAGSIKHLERSIALNPSYADAYSNLGAVYKEKKEYENAQKFYAKALSLNPEHINANFDMSLIELMRGNYALGWKQYEFRLGMDELISKLYRYKTPIWRGESLVGKRIILQNEQGFGDNIMFIRYATNFIALGAKVIIRTRAELVELFKTIVDIEAVYSEEEEIVSHDYHLPLLSSALLFQTTLQNIPSSFPYLHVKHLSDLVKKEKKDVLKIGLVYSSSRTNKDFKNKYLGLENFKSLFKLKGSAWYSLQAGEDAKEIKTLNLEDSIVDLSEHLNDFSTTASIINSLDLIITTDTSVAHLCGAMNKRAWVMVPRPSDWRWMQEGESTPWYKSLKLFRQSKSGSWKSVITEIENSLKKEGLKK